TAFCCQPMEAAIGPDDAILGIDFTSLLGMLDCSDDGRCPIGSVYHAFPGIVGPIESAWRQAKQSLLFRRPYIDLFLYIPIKGHRPRRLLGKIEKALIRLETIYGEFPFYFPA